MPHILQETRVTENTATVIDCSYHTVEDIKKLKVERNLNIFHTNINGLETKFDNLHEFISNTSSKLDIIAITETSQKNDESFILKTDIEGYVNCSTPNISKGGTALYINDKFDS